MEQITDFKQLISHLRHTGGRTTVAVAGGCDSSTRLAMEQAIQQGIANFYLVGDADDLGSVVLLLHEIGRFEGKAVLEVGEVV